jgi:excisionase family DNA binding protein
VLDLYADEVEKAITGIIVTTVLSAMTTDDSGKVGVTSTTPSLDRLLTAPEVAELLAVPERWVREHGRSGLIPCVRIGRYVRFRRESVDEWVERQEQGGAIWRKHRPKRSDSP